MHFPCKLQHCEINCRISDSHKYIFHFSRRLKAVPYLLVCNESLSGVLFEWCITVFTPQGVSCNLCIIFSFFSLLLFSSLFRFVECTDCGRKFHEICVYYCFVIWPGGWVKLKVFITSIICINPYALKQGLFLFFYTF